MSKQKHSASSGRWLKEHFDDKYVNEAKKKGYRSRAIFKIEEINPEMMLLGWFPMITLFGIVMAKKYEWNFWKAHLLGKGAENV